MKYEGVIYDLAEADYRSAEGLSQSSLKKIAKSPAHFRYGVESEDEQEDKQCLVLGRVTAALLLEPNRKPFWTIQPDKIKLNEKTGREWAMEMCGWDESKDGKFPKSAKDALWRKGITLISAYDFRCAEGMVAAVKNHPIAALALDGSKCEVSCFTDWPTDHGDVRVKCRHDIVADGSNAMVDLKSARNAAPDGFLRSVLQYGYAIQCASYMAIWNKLMPQAPMEVALLIAVEPEPPHGVMVHQLDQEFLAYGRQQWEAMLNLYAKCRAENSWPCYPTEISVLKLPERLKPQIDRP
jgi:hypothetical protein